MKKHKLPARLSAALLTLVMVLTLVPVAHAVTSYCPKCGAPCEMNVVREPNCHEEGIYEYLCQNQAGGCSMAGKSNLVKGDLNPSSHDAVYTDEGNGYHSGVCSHHAVPVTLSPEPHTFSKDNGVCLKCGAVNYGSVSLNLPENLVVPVALNSTDAKLSVGELKLTLGSANITDDYTISYNWYYDGFPVASTAEYTLPSTVTGKAGTYYYILFVSAVPKSSLRQPVAGSCNVTVQVKDLITAGASVSSDETSFFLGDPDTWSGESVSSQIYAGVQDVCPRNADPAYVIFQTLPSSTVGSLGVSANLTRYYFEDGSNRNCLDDVRFNIAAGASATTGDYIVGFTAYDTAGNAYEGVLTITVQQYAGRMDVVMSTARNTPAALNAGDFESFWLRTYTGGVLDSISFRETPRSTEGSLNVDYISASSPGVRLTTKDTFYVQPGRDQYGINDVTFVPGVKQTDYITLDFTAQGARSNGRVGYLDGTLYIFFSGSGSADVAVTAASAGTALSPESFRKAYQSATGGAGTSFYIQLLEVPAKGALYVGRTATRAGTLLTDQNIVNYTFSYSDSRGESISTVTYIPNAGTTADSVRYVACSSQGAPLYTGTITFTAASAAPGATATPSTTGLLLNLTCPAGGVKLSAASFENLLGAAGPKLTMVSFPQFSSSYGAIYYGRTESSPGTAITPSNAYYSVVTTNPPAGSLSMDNLTFVPAAGVTGVVPIAFTAVDASNAVYTGTLRITVTGAAGTTTAPGSTTTPGAATTPAKPQITFSDVSPERWSYPDIMQLVSTGVFNGYDDGTFKPEAAITLGQALKVIMIAANPEEYTGLAPTGKHWASGYLDRAVKDNLLPAGINQDLDRNVSRYNIAEIAVRTMGLQPVANPAASPFKDMALNVPSAPYVIALYNIGVFTGSDDGSFLGANAIKREDFAAVVCRIQRYVQTGATGIVNGANASGDVG